MVVAEPSFPQAGEWWPIGGPSRQRKLGDLLSAGPPREVRRRAGSPPGVMQRAGQVAQARRRRPARWESGAAVPRVHCSQPECQPPAAREKRLASGRQRGGRSGRPAGECVRSVASSQPRPGAGQATTMTRNGRSEPEEEHQPGEHRQGPEAPGPLVLLPAERVAFGGRGDGCVWRPFEAARATTTAGFAGSWVAGSIHRPASRAGR